MGCAAPERVFEPELTLPESFGVEGWPEDDGRASVPDRWWRVFNDETLNALQDRALSANFDLEAVRQRARQARAVFRRERSFLFPSLDYNLFAQETRRESNDFEAENTFGASAIGTYQADVWAQNRSLARNARLSAAVAEERLRAAAIALSADVAQTYFALVEQRGQANILEQQIRTNEQVLRVVRARFGSGVVRASDVLRQERLLESTRAQIQGVRANVRVLENALQVLVGRPPTDQTEASLDTLPETPDRPPLGLPAELVRRRPDVRSDMLAIRAADAELAAAVADQFPNVTLSLDAATIEQAIGDLFNDWFAVLGIDVLGPLFDAGRRRAEIRRAEAFKSERAAAYAQSVLIALRQVLDAVAQESALERQIALIKSQLELAARTSERLNREYLNGDISYIDVLDALTTEQRLQRDLLSTRLARLNARINLYVALAGGWPGLVESEPLAGQRNAPRPAPEQTIQPGRERDS